MNSTKLKTQKRNAQLIRWLQEHGPKTKKDGRNYTKAANVFHISRERVRQIVKEWEGAE
jgi:DNA-binding Lrp family transcriptional regulator